MASAVLDSCQGPWVRVHAYYIRRATVSLVLDSFQLSLWTGRERGRKGEGKEGIREGDSDR